MRCIHIVELTRPLLRKKLRFILSDKFDFHIINNPSIAVHAFASHVLISFSVHETLLSRYVNLFTTFRESPFSAVSAKIKWICRDWYFYLNIVCVLLRIKVSIPGIFTNDQRITHGILDEYQFRRDFSEEYFKPCPFGLQIIATLAIDVKGSVRTQTRGHWEQSPNWPCARFYKSSPVESICALENLHSYFKMWGVFFFLKSLLKLRLFSFRFIAKYKECKSSFVL